MQTALGLVRGGNQTTGIRSVLEKSGSLGIRMVNGFRQVAVHCKNNGIYVARRWSPCEFPENQKSSPLNNAIAMLAGQGSNIKLGLRFTQNDAYQGGSINDHSQVSLYLGMPFSS